MLSISIVIAGDDMRVRPVCEVRAELDDVIEECSQYLKWHYGKNHRVYNDEISFCFKRIKNLKLELNRARWREFDERRK